MEGSEGEGELKILVALLFSYKKQLLLTSMCFEGYNQRKKSVLDIGQCYFSLNFSHFTMDQWNLCQRSEVLCELHLKTTHSQVVLKNPPASTGDTRASDLIPVLGRSPGEGNANSLQYSNLGNPMDRGEESDMTEHIRTANWHRASGLMTKPQFLLKGNHLTQFIRLFQRPYSDVKTSDAQ